MLQSGKTTILGRGNNPTNFVAGRDVARFAVVALTDPRAKKQNSFHRQAGEFDQKPRDRIVWTHVRSHSPSAARAACSAAGGGTCCGNGHLAFKVMSPAGM